MIDFWQFVFPEIGSNMFVSISGAQALVIDPHVARSAEELFEQNDVNEATILLTHEHYDHTSGLVWFADHYDCTVICHEETAKALQEGRNNRPLLFATSFRNGPNANAKLEYLRTLPSNYIYVADITFKEGYRLNWNNNIINCVSTPGHSSGSCCIEINGDTVATGDSLILDTPVITRFPGSSEADYDKIVVPYLQKLPKTTYILPGHGKTFFIHELTDKNLERLGCRSRTLENPLKPARQ